MLNVTPLGVTLVFRCNKDVAQTHPRKIKVVSKVSDDQARLESSSDVTAARARSWRSFSQWRVEGRQLSVSKSSQESGYSSAQRTHRFSTSTVIQYNRQSTGKAFIRVLEHSNEGWLAVINNRQDSISVKRNLAQFRITGCAHVSNQWSRWESSQGLNPIPRRETRNTSATLRFTSYLYLLYWAISKYNPKFPVPLTTRDDHIVYDASYI